MARRMLHDFIILALLAATTQVVESQLQIAPQVVYQKLENTLIADSSLLYKLQEVLISSKIWPQSLVHFHIRVKVGSTRPLDCENSSLPGGRSIFPYYQDFQWSSSALVDMISIDQLFILDNVISYKVFGTIERHDGIFVPLQIDTLPCEPTKDELQAAFMQLLPWVKSYARAPGQRNENDKGHVSIRYLKYVEESYYDGTDSSLRHFYRLAVMLTFIFLSILTPIALSKMVFLYYPKISTKFTTGDYLDCLYSSIAFMSFLSNILYTLLSIRTILFWNRPTITSCLIYQNCPVFADQNLYKDEFLTVLFVYVIVPSAVFIELLVSVVAVKHNLRSRRNGQHPSWKQFLSQGFHVLALWNILITIQLLTMIATPICVLLFIHPQVTVLFVLLLFVIPVSLTLILAYLLFQCQKQRRRVCRNAESCGQKFVQIVLMIAIPGLIFALLGLYEVMVLVQVQIGTGVKGLLLSLLPSFPLSALGWYLKRRSQKKAKKSDDSETQQLDVEEHQSEDIRPLPV